MPSLYLRRLSHDDREALVIRLHDSQAGNCFICGKRIDLRVHGDSTEIDHIEPISAGGKDGPENFAITHGPCNRLKQASDLRVARVLASFSEIADRVATHNRSPNLGDVLAQYGGSKYMLPIDVSDGVLKTSFPDMDSSALVTLPIYADSVSGFRSCFIELPIEYLHHDSHINPRAIGSNLRKLVEEFHRRRPQLHVGLAWINTTEGDRVQVNLFDGQHKAVAQVLLGARVLPLRIFIDPDTDVLLTTNTNAGTALRQVAFDRSVQRSLGSSILSSRMDLYRQALSLDEEEESFSERDLVNHFQGEGRQMHRYVLDRVRNSITTHRDNKLKDFIELGGRSTDKPLSYSAVESTFYQFFIDNQLLTTPFNYKLEEGANPRQLEIDQTVRLMNIMADDLYWAV